MWSCILISSYSIRTYCPFVFGTPPLSRTQVLIQIKTIQIHKLPPQFYLKRLSGPLGLRSDPVMEILGRNANSLIISIDFGLLSDSFRLLSDLCSDSLGSHSDLETLRKTTYTSMF